MPRPLAARLEALEKVGFRISKYREIKSGTQYKVLLPRPLRKMSGSFTVLDSYEEAIAYAEGMAEVWFLVQRKVTKDIEEATKAFGIDGK